MSDSRQVLNGAGPDAPRVTTLSITVATTAALVNDKKARKLSDQMVKTLERQPFTEVTHAWVEFQSRYEVSNLWKTWSGMGDYHVVMLSEPINALPDVLPADLHGRVVSAIDGCDAEGVFSLYNGPTMFTSDLGLALLRGASIEDPYVYWNQPAWAFALAMSKRNAADFWRWCRNGARPLGHDLHTYRAMIGYWSAYVKTIPTIYPMPTLIEPQL